MRRTLRILVACLALGSACQTAQAQDGGELQAVRDDLERLAFDPAKFFPSPYVQDRSTVRIVYTGDDYGWPVYAIAIAEGCIDGEARPKDRGASRWRARMVRAPAVPGVDRPRQRGGELVSRLVRAGATSADGLREALNTAGVEWVEADLRTCPGATRALAQSADAAWVPEAVAAPKPNDEQLVLHADIVRVEVQQYARLSTYRGWLAERSPGAWAVDLASTLGPCWRPATIAAPWLLTPDARPAGSPSPR